MEGGCKVCGDKASGKHYGVPSCDGCRGFFKRSIRRKLDYVCKDKGECVVDVTRRNQCQACRFNKCLRVNMKRDAVQNERVSRERGSFSGCSSSGSCTTVHRSSLYSPLLSLPPPPSVVQSPSFHFSTHNVLGRLGLSYWSSSDNQVREDEVTSSQEAIQSNYLLRRCSSDGAGVSGVSVTGLAETTATGLLMLDSADKLLSLSLASVRAIPSFQQLPGDVQRRLLEESWKDLFILTAAQWQFNFADVVRKDEVDRETSDGLIRMTPDTDQLIKPNLSKINRFVDRLRDLRPDHTEYACMKTLVLFRPEWCGDNDVQTRQVELVQEQTYQMLREYSGSLSRTRSLVLVLLSLAALDQEIISATYFHRSPIHRLHLL